MSYSFVRSSSQYGLVTANLITNYPFSIGCWIKPASFPGQCMAFSFAKTGDDVNLLELYVDTATILKTYRRNAAATVTSNPTPTLSINTWYYAAIVSASRTSFVGYVGTTAGTVATTDLQGWSAAQNFDRVAVGALNRNAGAGGIQSFFDGKLAEPAVWNGYALTSGDIASLAGGARSDTISPGSLSAWWRFHIDEGTTVSDQIGTNDLTITGATFSAGDHPVADIVHDVGGTLAATGHAVLSGDPFSYIKYWRLPSNAPQGTNGRLVVFNGGSLANTLAFEGAVTADASGNFDLMTTDDQFTLGTKRFAALYVWDGTTTTTSIYGGPGIVEVIQVVT